MSGVVIASGSKSRSSVCSACSARRDCAVQFAQYHGAAIAEHDLAGRHPVGAEVDERADGARRPTMLAMMFSFRPFCSDNTCHHRQETAAKCASPRRCVCAFTARKMLPPVAGQFRRRERRRRHAEFFHRAGDAQAVRRVADRGDMLRYDIDKRHVVAGAFQPRADRAADRAGAPDQDRGRPCHHSSSRRAGFVHRDVPDFQHLGIVALVATAEIAVVQHQPHLERRQTRAADRRRPSAWRLPPVRDSAGGSRGNSPSSSRGRRPDRCARTAAAVSGARHQSCKRTRASGLSIIHSCASDSGRLVAAVAVDDQHAAEAGELQAVQYVAQQRGEGRRRAA